MKPSIRTLGEILYSPSQYVIPVFQRNYRWERPQWAKLWNSLIDIQAPEKRGNHFMGFLVFVPGVAQPGQHTTFHLIDGQQRLTTSSLILAALRNVAREKGQQDLAEEIDQYYLTHPRKKGEQYFRLLPKERDHDSYVSVITGQGQPTGRVADALCYFEEQLTELAEVKIERLRQTFDVLCQRLEFMCATLEAENAYNIFKSLNSTGVPLGQSDLIRNFVFMHVQPDDHDEFDHDLWKPLENFFATADGTLDEDRISKFFRDYLMSSGKYVSPKDTFANFETRYEATDFSPKELVRDLIVKAGDYSIILSKNPDEDNRVTEALAGLNLLESSTTFPLLLILFEKRRSSIIDSDQLAAAVNMLRGFILRRFVCNETSRGYGQMFVRALAKNESDPIKTLETYFLDRGWPDDYRFETAFVEFPLYKRDYAREILETLEYARGHKEPAHLESTQIEHVMPQTLNEAWVKDLGSNADAIHADWLHRPGNLTLSGYNLPLWNHPFKKKRDHYKESNVVLTRELAGYDRWTENEIQARGRQLAKEASKIWVGPKEQIIRDAKVDNDNDDESPGRRELRSRFWGGLNDYLVAEYPDVPDFEPRPSWALHPSSGIRHIGFGIRFGLRHQNVGVDILFRRNASLPVWERIYNEPLPWSELVEAKWEFEKVEDRTRARMFLNKSCADLRDEASWPEAYSWLGNKLSLIYAKVAPKLSEEIDRYEATE